MGQLVEKSYAIFGGTATGKSILNKLVCVGIFARSVGSVLIFDMHGEYGIHSQTDSTEGLKFFFPGKEELQALRRSEEHTSELQSQSNLVCRLLLEKKK